MRLADLIAPEDVLADLRAGDKASLIVMLGRRLAPRAGLADALVVRALQAREGLGSTGIGRGVALPHAWLPGASGPVGVFVRLARPIGFDAVDEQPVDLVCALVGPDPGGGRNVAALAAVARLLRDADAVARLRKAADAAALHRALAACGGPGKAPQP